MRFVSSVNEISWKNYGTEVTKCKNYTISSLKLRSQFAQNS